MNYVEEQKNELEALSEIYYNEIKIHSRQTPVSFSIKVRPQASSYDEHEANRSDGEDDESDEVDSDEESSIEESTADQQKFSVEIKFELPPKYPDEKPSIEIMDSQNLDEDNLTNLMDMLSQKAEESLGTVMVFILVSDVVEWLMGKSEEDAEEIEQEKEKKQKEIEAEEKKRFEGTPVTESTFLAWKAKFDAEMLKAKFEQQKQQAEQGASVKKLTGRAMFESDKSLAESDLNFVEDLDQNQIEALLHNIEEVDLGDYEEEENDEYEVSDDEADLDLEDLSDEESEEEIKQDKKISTKR